MFDFVVFATGNIAVTFVFTEKVKDFLNTDSKAGAWFVAIIVSFIVPLALFFGADQIVEFIAQMTGTFVDFEPRPENFPLAGYILTAIINLFGAGGIYDFRKHIGGKQ